MHERWYPLTYPGYYRDTLEVTPSVSHECCGVDVSAYRGCAIGLHAVPGAGNRALHQRFISDFAWLKDL